MNSLDNLLLSDEELQTIKDSDYPTYKGWSPCNSLLVAVAKSQLAKVLKELERRGICLK